MSDPTSGNPAEPLQFDRAVDANAASPDAQQAEPSPFITCSNCQTQIKTYYYNVDDNAVCAKCKQEIGASAPGNESLSTAARHSAGGACMHKYGFRLKKKAKI